MLGAVKSAPISIAFQAAVSPFGSRNAIHTISAL